jgi:signal transduction histidine kinase
MSHELRTPLNSIIGFSNVLLKNRAGALRQQEVVYLQRILANGSICWRSSTTSSTSRRWRPGGCSSSASRWRSARSWTT